MKRNFIKLSLILGWISIAGSSYAKDVKVESLSNEEKLYAVNSYVNSFCHGKHDELLQILDENAEFNISSPLVQVSYKASTYIRFLDQDLEQNCQTDFEIVKETEYAAEARLNIRYPGHQQTVLLSITKNPETGSLIITKIDRYFN